MPAGLFRFKIRNAYIQVQFAVVYTAIDNIQRVLSLLGIPLQGDSHARLIRMRQTMDKQH